MVHFAVPVNPAEIFAEAPRGNGNQSEFVRLKSNGQTKVNLMIAEEKLNAKGVFSIDEYSYAFIS